MAQSASTAGPPRAWQAGVTVSPFSTYNMINGNVLTAVPLVGIDPVGPPIGFSLYHNSGMALANESGQPGQGFTIGNGWSTSYSGRVQSIDPNTVVVHEDDGTRNTYTLGSGALWNPPPGVFDRLVHDITTVFGDANTPYWILTRPDQTQRIFSDLGYVLFVKDAVGNTVTVFRDAENSNRITHVSSAAEGRQSVSSHRLTLTYDDPNNKITISDVLTPARQWVLVKSSGKLSQVQWPSYGSDPNDPNYVAASTNAFTYTGNRLASVADRLGRTWTHTYPTGARITVKDPGPGTDPNGFYTQATGNATVEGETSVLFRTYTDRRGKSWKVRWENGKVIGVVDPLSKQQSFTFNSSNLLTQYCDELSHCWTMTYGSVGNLLTATSPLTSATQQWEITWVQPDPNNRPNFWRPQYVYDPLDHWVKYEYDNNSYPTLVTRVIEMQASGSDPNGQSTTTLEYWLNDSTYANSHGQLKRVTDANGVKHEFKYDARGFPAELREGYFPSSTAFNTVDFYQENDAAGRDIAGSSDAVALGLATCATKKYSVLGGLLKVSCCPTRSGEIPLRLGKVAAPHFSAVSNCADGNRFDVLLRPKYLNRCIGSIQTGLDDDREYTFGYEDNGLRRLTSLDIKHTEGSQGPISRLVQNIQYEPAGITDLSGPGSMNLGIDYDNLGRAYYVERQGDPNNLTATIGYDDASRVTTVAYGNGASVTNYYDEADRVYKIEHKQGSALKYKVEYWFNLDNMVYRRVETDNVASTVATVDFEYDNRQRLTGEKRVVGSTTVYDIAYTYDGLGNRKTKVDLTSGLYTAYYYDVELNPSDPNHWDPNYATKNNRLVSYEVRSGSATGTLLRTVEYTYYKTGDVSNISLKDEYQGSGDPSAFDWWYDLAFYPYTNGTVAIIANGKFKMDNGEPNLSTYQRTAAREYAYDDPRARWLARELNPSTLAPTTVQSWTDHLGVAPWSDFDVELNGSQPVATEQRRYLGTAAEQDAAGTRYLHGDLIDSTVMTTSGSGSPVGTLAYTAFGEPIGDPNALATRYRYAGGWGYDSGFVTLVGPNANLAPITLQHVGARWYEPAIGRFVQRDSIGLDAGLNVYVYCFNSPLVLVDPTGNDSVIDWIARNYWMRLYSVDHLARMSDNEAVVHATGHSIIIGCGLTGGAAAAAASGRAVVIGVGRAAQGGVTIAYKVGPRAAPWLFGAASLSPKIHPHWPSWQPFLRIPIPIPFPGNVPGIGDPAGASCVVTAGSAILRGWGL